MTKKLKATLVEGDRDRALMIVDGLQDSSDFDIEVIGEETSLARVGGDHGDAVLRVLVTDSVRPGEVFTPLHWTGPFAIGVGHVHAGLPSTYWAMALTDAGRRAELADETAMDDWAAHATRLSGRRRQLWILLTRAAQDAGTRPARLSC